MRVGAGMRKDWLNALPMVAIGCGGPEMCELLEVGAPWVVLMEMVVIRKLLRAL